MIDENAIEQLFTEARTINKWSDEKISEETLNKLYDLTKMGPTATNCCPARFVFVQSDEAKARLKPHLMGGNIDKTMQAPVCVIVATDPKYYEQVPKLFPHMPQARDMYANAPDGGEKAGFRNGTLQAAYLIIAARALGLDCGPMSGFNNVSLDEEFFKDSGYESNFLINIGKKEGDGGIYPRGPRLSFEEACEIL